MISSLIFCFVVGAVLAAEEDSRSAYIKTQENKRLHGYVVKKIDSTDEMSCSQACLRHSWCTSSNFKESSGNCELNKHEFSTTDDDTKLTDNPGTTFSMFLKVRKVLNFHCLDNKGVRVQTSLISACKKKQTRAPRLRQQLFKRNYVKKQKFGKTVKLSCCKRALASTRISVICFVWERAKFFSSATSLSKTMFSSLTTGLYPSSRGRSQNT